ncbi:ROK family transcriptional regulator, partial [Rhizobium ruizarguesonis]
LENLTQHLVFIENEANAASLAELDYGLGAESSSFFYIAINPFPGGGLVLDGNDGQDRQMVAIDVDADGKAGIRIDF